MRRPLFATAGTVLEMTVPGSQLGLWCTNVICSILRLLRRCQMTISTAAQTKIQVIPKVAQNIPLSSMSLLLE